MPLLKKGRRALCALCLTLLLSTVWAFALFPSAGTVYGGMDVSICQGHIDFGAAAEDGKEAVYIQAGQVFFYVDPHHKTDFENAADGQDACFYYYVAAINTADARTRSAAFARRIRDMDYIMRPAMDDENFGNLGAATVNAGGGPFGRSCSAPPVRRLPSTSTPIPPRPSGAAIWPSTPCGWPSTTASGTAEATISTPTRDGWLGSTVMWIWIGSPRGFSQPPRFRRPPAGQMSVPIRYGQGIPPGTSPRPTASLWRRWPPPTALRTRILSIREKSFRPPAPKARKAGRGTPPVPTRCAQAIPCGASPRSTALLWRRSPPPMTFRSRCSSIRGRYF